MATTLSLRTGIPAAFVRKEAKAYGTRRLAEGSDVAGLELRSLFTSGDAPDR